MKMPPVRRSGRRHFRVYLSLPQMLPEKRGQFGEVAEGFRIRYRKLRKIGKALQSDMVCRLW